jgi:hypothetical protein
MLIEPASKVSAGLPVPLAIKRMRSRAPESVYPPEEVDILGAVEMTFPE